MELPDCFKDSMKALLLSEYDEFIRSYDDSAYSGLRVNTSRISCKEFERIAPFYIEKIPFISNGYYINESDEWSKHPYYHAGLYYLQEPSAMLVAEAIPVKAGDTVLDLCAAPGGKSTEISIRDPGFLMSNDISFSRTIPLVKNLELFGRGNYCVTCCEPSELAARFSESFDKIIVDAPCSGEGMFRKDKSLIRSYEKKGPGAYHEIQRSILEQAYLMLKPGGMMLYSTCTFSDIEDEQVVLSLLNDHDDVKLIPIDRSCGLNGPYDKYKDEPELSGCVHAMPHRIKGEGHFLALMQKEKSDRHDNREVTARFASKLCDLSDLPQSVSEFIANACDDAKDSLKDKKYLVAKDGFIYMLPYGCENYYDSSVRYVRTGTCIGSLNKSGRFIPHTAFALTLDHKSFANSISFDADDPRVIKYLKGETIEADPGVISDQKGYVLICVDSFALGFAKPAGGGKLKNLYEKGWILR